ncbi:MAG: hypothetical protein J6V92_09630, partial [Bacteroidaceae bacterium]|nr:hypothetical protein [Bacteroidaceae bacterium]
PQDETQEVVGQNKNDPVGQDFKGVKNKRFSGVNAALPSGVKRARLFQQVPTRIYYQVTLLPSFVVVVTKYMSGRSLLRSL